MEDDFVPFGNFVFFGSSSLGDTLYYEALREEAARIAADKKEKKEAEKANGFTEEDYENWRNYSRRVIW